MWYPPYEGSHPGPVSATLADLTRRRRAAGRPPGASPRPVDRPAALRRLSTAAPLFFLRLYQSARRALFALPDMANPRVSRLSLLIGAAFEVGPMPAHELPAEPPETVKRRLGPGNFFEPATNWGTASATLAAPTRPDRSTSAADRLFAPYAPPTRSWPAATRRPDFVADQLVVDDPADWISSEQLLDGTSLDELLALPQRLWSAPPHAAAVLAWKTYTYRLAQPLATAWALAREVPLLSADNVLIKIESERPYIRVGLRRSTSAVLATSTAARSHDAIVIPDETSLLAFLRDTLIDGHLRPLLEKTQEHQRIGTRVLWGQAAAGIAYALAEMSDQAGHDTAMLTRALGLDGLAGVGEDDKVWRKTCCLAMSTPTLNTCNDCCTLPRQR